MTRVFVVGGARTPFLKSRGVPGPFSAADLAVVVARSVMARSGLEPGEIDEVIVGCVSPAADEANIARIVALRAGCPITTPAHTVQRNCASGLEAVVGAAGRIREGRAQAVLAGGTEAMSRIPIQWNAGMSRWLGEMNKARDWERRLQTLSRFRRAFLKPVYALLLGLRDPVVSMSMGETAEVLAHRFGISRAEQDEYAITSHQRLASAVDRGVLESETELLFDRHGTPYTHDDGLRRDSDPTQLARLRPVFDVPYGSVTAGNSSQVSDGAAMLLLASEALVKARSLPVLGELLGDEWAGVDPRQMGLGPVHAMAKLLPRLRLRVRDFDHVELNEAFAAQVLACQAALDSRDYARQELGLDQPLGSIDPERLNPEGGAIALGHPVGATGARLVLHTLAALRARGGGTGLAALCIGGGQGGAAVMRVEAS